MDAALALLGPTPQEGPDRCSRRSKGAAGDDRKRHRPLSPIAAVHKTDRLQRRPLFSNQANCGPRVESRIEQLVDFATELVQNARQALEKPQDIARPLKRLFDITPEETLYLFLLRENLAKLERKLGSPVESRCSTRKELRRSEGSPVPRAFAELDPQTKMAKSDSGIVYNRNIFRITGATTRRQIVNTVLHEYLHLVRVGHGEADPGASIGNKNSIKVRGLTKDEAINNAESHVRFIRAVN